MEKACESVATAGNRGSDPIRWGEAMSARMLSFAAALCFPAAVLIPAATAAAQDHDHYGDAAALGDVHFPVSCTPEAQAKFNTAAALLYSFYWERIDAAVADVLAADPTCSMAYWVQAIASIDNVLGSPPTPAMQKRGWAAVQAAQALGGGKTPRERAYLSAAQVLLENYETVPFATRAIAYEQALEQLYRTYPDDSEAAILYAFWLQVTADRNDPGHVKQLASARILDEIFARQPNHPGVAHFIIHAYDFPPIAAQGLDAARRYAAIAPDSPHALHMPSHIFSRVGQWRDSIATNIRSHSAAKADRDAYHAMDYMVYAYLQIGADGDAAKWVDEVRTAGKPDEDARQIAYAAAAIPARHALERGDWTAAAQLALYPARDAIDWGRFPEGEAVNAYARGLGAARRGDAAGAQVELARIAALRAALIAQGKDYWVEQADIQAGAIAAWAARAEGRNAEALKRMRAAADLEDRTEEHIMMPGRVIPVREMLGELLLDLGRPALALAAFEQSLTNDPNRFRGLYGAARAAERSGDREKAGRYYRQLLDQVDPTANRPEIARARAFMRRR